MERYIGVRNALLRRPHDGPLDDERGLLLADWSPEAVASTKSSMRSRAGARTGGWRDRSWSFRRNAWARIGDTLHEAVDEAAGL